MKNSQYEHNRQRANEEQRRSQVVIKAQVIIFHKIFLSGCYECLHVRWSVINSVSFAVLMSYNSLKAQLPLQ